MEAVWQVVIIFSVLISLALFASFGYPAITGDWGEYGGGGKKKKFKYGNLVYVLVGLLVLGGLGSQVFSRLN